MSARFYSKKCESALFYFQFKVCEVYVRSAGGIGLI